MTSSAAASTAPAVSGLPLHSRALSLEILQESPTRLRAQGTILDLRKCGFVPTGGELQTAGVVHHMHWGALLEDPAGRIESLEIAQPVVAMEASAATGGECCRDPAPRLQALVGTAVDAGFPKRLAATFGGPLGCSHLLTLGQALGAFVPKVLADPARDPAARARGERIAKRAISLDGFERGDEQIQLAIQLADYRLAPLAKAPDLAARLARVTEVRVLATVTQADMRLLEIRAAVRARDARDVQATERLGSDPKRSVAADWRDHSDAIAPLAGGSALRGMAARIRERLSALAEGETRDLLREALLQLAPGLIQCVPALSHRLGSFFARPSAARQTPPTSPDSANPLLTTGGMADSCFMWRAKPALKSG